MYTDDRYVADRSGADCGEVLDRLLAEKGICRPELRSDIAPSTLGCSPTCKKDARRSQSGACCFPDGKPVGMVYAPVQEWRHLYEIEKALSRGTLFEELDLVFLGGCGCKGGARHE